MWNQESYQKAIDFAARKHGDQKVPGKEYSYVVHLCNVAAEASRAMFEEVPEDPNLIIQAALLHDVLEDTDTTVEEIIAEFGLEVAKVVKALTKNQEIQKQDRMKDSLIRIARAGSAAATIKLCDRITNMQKPPGHWSVDKKRNYFEEARMIREYLGSYHTYLSNRLDSCIDVYQKNINK